MIKKDKRIYEVGIQNRDILIKDWIKENEVKDFKGFSLIDLEERIEICNEMDCKETQSSEIVNFLQNRLLDDRINLTLLQESIDLLGSDSKNDILSNMIPTDKEMQSGEFGETISEIILEVLYDYQIPIRKRRYAINKDQVLPSTDTIAFKIKNDEIIELCLLESKLRNGEDYNAVTDAYGQLKTKYESRIPDMLMFTLQRMDEMKHTLLDPYKNYLSKRSQDKSCDKFIIGLIWNKLLWRNGYLGKFQRAEKDGPDIKIQLVKIKELEKIIEHIFKKLLTENEK